MPKIAYITKRFSEVRVKLLEQASEIITEYREQGFYLTLRQIYYQFVARDLFPEDRRWQLVESKWVRDLDGTKNATPNYKWLGDTISDGRMAGILDWNSIEDRTRNLQSNSHWNGPADILSTCARQYQEDKQAGQEYRMEVWIEKDALIGVISDVCSRLDIPYFSCRGYTSQSEMWVAGQRLAGYVEDNQKPLILHFGDHDSSGVDMSRDIRDRLQIFMGGTELKRLALNMDQIEEFKPPPNPAKIKDPRAKAYIAEFGAKSWELDALEPSVLSRLIETTAEQYRDKGLWQEACDRERHNKEKIQEFADTIE